MNNLFAGSYCSDFLNFIAFFRDFGVTEQQ